MQRLLERGDAAQAVERLQTMRSNITVLVGELRMVIGDLRPPALEELGLLPAAALLLQRGGEGGPEVALLVRGEERRLAPQSELALFRIIQEAWSNIRRHARATLAEITFRYAAGGLVVSIADDGVGFTLPDGHDTPDGHWGVRGMRERAELTGGQLDVASVPGRGPGSACRSPTPAWMGATRSAA